ncbi:unnamed protein product [Rangifer tarandus platyrhynchus]|uniref:Uncharacterized protein n=1 Tax=Rangifer tarandus platyrhynchus TaxID=3082113 RepID=A0AC59YG67_RANTA
MPNLKSQDGAEMTLPRPAPPTQGGVYSLTGNYPLANFEQEIADSSPCVTQTLLSNPGEVKESREKPGESQTEESLKRGGEGTQQEPPVEPKDRGSEKSQVRS